MRKLRNEVLNQERFADAGWAMDERGAAVCEPLPERFEFVCPAKDPHRCLASDYVVWGSSPGA
jgi:hypothetical protein